MKKIFLRLLSGLTVACCLFTACSSDDDPIAPKFPTPVSATVTAGEVYSLTIEPNTVWTLSIPTEAMSYFSFIDGESNVYTLKGAAGSVTVQVKVADIEEFDVDRVCEVQLTLGTGNLQETRTVATLTRSQNIRAIKLSVAPVSEYDVESDDFAKETDGSYKYVETNTLALYYDSWNNSYKQRIKVESNCSWMIGEAPAWLTLSATEGTAEEAVEIRVLSNNEKLPFEDETKSIVFSDFTDSENPKQVAAMSVTMQGCKNYLNVSLSKTMAFNTDGTYDNNGSASEIGAIGRMTAAKGAVIYKAAKVDGWYYTEDSKTSWIQINNDEWDTAASETEGIWDRTFNVLTAANTGAAREGVLIILPRALAANITNPDSDLFNSEGTEVKADYKDYAYTISQAAKEVAELFTVKVQTDKLEDVGASFDEVKDNWHYYDYPCDKGFELLYTKEWSSDGWYLNNNFEYDAIEYYAWNPAGGNYKKVSEDDSWLKYIESESGNRVNMNTSKAEPNTDANNQYEGYIVFKKSDTIVTFIYCRYDANATIGGGGSTGFAFVDASMASAVGAQLTEIVAGDEDYSAENAGMGIAQYRLTYTSLMAMSMASYAAFTCPDYLYTYCPTEGFVSVAKDQSGNTYVTPLTENNGKVTIQFLSGSSMVATLVVVVNVPM